MTRAGTLRARVVEVIRETADAHSLVLEPADGDHARFGYRPGQFLTIRVPTTRPEGAARCYSLSSSPLCDEKLKVTVKRTRGGYGSNWICDHVTEGDVLEVLRPAGTFVPASLDEDLLLLAGGSGITPVMSILKSCLRAGTGAVALVYANRDESSVIFRDELIALSAEHGERLTVVHWLESVQGLPAPAALAALTRPYAGREAFVCGPGPFMDLAVQVLTGLGVPRRRVNVERFESLAADPFAAPEPVIDPSGPGSTVEVELDGEKRTLAWPKDAKLLDVMLAAGMEAPYSCREGSCSACACVLLEGEVALERNSILDDQDLADGLTLSCQATPVSDHIKITYDG
ncbi:3-ketosteroid-9-alpha-hydroxylase reductase subunit [Sphaerisporangium krabiense]|uniref:3-ketosteroid 9alpha-monooxygenase subunit B n=1 Tax=Sphaerisporangium krabiense TaxID=763782 RepID=A0A7W8Z0G1_9ACTN|nr:ferredoxin--NADP reductase [Sphaerisporangium krabiense]MBB5625182.1 3-ketosteroid 9alpha-monooxygenase subunit B [Sphaerisporangium krabiense]GII64310.1 3-ketosteroid-9-alpha-hydroxylase reductase subunit [Sphaerisporangium krabiense]